MCIYPLSICIYTSSMCFNLRLYNVNDRSLAASFHVTRSGAASATQNSSLLRIAREQGIELTCCQLQETRAECHGSLPGGCSGSDNFCDTASRILALQHGKSMEKQFQEKLAPMPFCSVLLLKHTVTASQLFRSNKKKGCPI